MRVEIHNRELPVRATIVIESIEDAARVWLATNLPAADLRDLYHGDNEDLFELVETPPAPGQETCVMPLWKACDNLLTTWRQQQL